MNTPSQTTNMCVILPPTMERLADVELLRQTPNLSVHHIGYDDPPAVRDARRRGQLTEELAAQCPTLSSQDAAALAGAEVVIARDLPLDLKRRAPKLRWVQAVGAGIE